MKKPLILCHLLLVAAMAADIPSDDYQRFWNTAPTIMPSTIVSSSSSRPTTSRPPTTPPPTCPPRYVGNVPHPDFCNQFFWCSAWGQPYLNTCQAGFEFDPASKTCVRIAPGGCTLSRPSSTTQRPTTPGSFTTEDFEVSTNPPITDPPICPPGFVGNMPYPRICNAYFTCNEWGGTSTMRYCSAGFEFDPTLRICVRIAPGGCTLGGTTAATAATDVPSTPVFSTSGGFEVTTVLSSTSAPPAPSSCASGFMGTVPHPDLCNSFFMCLGSAAIQMYCTSGHEYDAQLRTCVQLAPGGCTLGNVTTESP